MNPNIVNPDDLPDEPTPAERAERLIAAAQERRDYERDLLDRHFTRWS